MLFYKYQSVSPQSLSMLKHGEVFFASPQELNDTHEAKPKYIFRGDEDVWQKFVYLVLFEICIILKLNPNSELSSKILSLRGRIINQIKSTEKRSFEYQEMVRNLFLFLKNSIPTDWEEKEIKLILASYNYYTNNILETQLGELIYIAAFSMSAKNLTMWGHYGEAEKGFCLVYESLNGCVDIESNCDLFVGCWGDENSTQTIGHINKTSVKLNKVKYSKNPARINGFGRLSKHFFYSEQESHYDYREEVFRKTTKHNKDNILAALFQLKKIHMPHSELFVFQAESITNRYEINVSPLGTITDNYVPSVPMIISLSKSNKEIRQEAEMISEIINKI